MGPIRSPCSTPFQGLCDRAVGQLLSLLGSPYLVPGGGCLESAIAWKLRQNLVRISIADSSSFLVMYCKQSHSAILSSAFMNVPTNFTFVQIEASSPMTLHISPNHFKFLLPEGTRPRRCRRQQQPSNLRLQSHRCPASPR